MRDERQRLHAIAERSLGYKAAFARRNVGHAQRDERQRLLAIAERSLGKPKAFTGRIKVARSVTSDSDFLQSRSEAWGSRRLTQAVKRKAAGGNAKECIPPGPPLAPEVSECG